jgi:hypothetical protein
MNREHVERTSLFQNGVAYVTKHFKLLVLKQHKVLSDFTWFKETKGASR